MEIRNKQTAYKQAFNEKAYDRLAITVPKGRKHDIEIHAKKKGESINALVNGLIRADMEITEHEWKKESSQ